MAESSAFSSAMQSFHDTLSPSDADQIKKVATLGDLTLAIRDIEREQAQRRSLRSMSKIRPFLNSLEEYSKVIEVFVNAKPDVLSFIWGPIKLCLQIASNHQKTFDALLDAYGKIGDSIPIITAVDDLFKSRRHVELTLVDVYKDILLFHERAVSFFRNKGWRIALLITCRTFEDLFGDVLKNLERSKRLLYTSADIAHFHEAQEARISFQEEFRRHQAIQEEQRKFRVLDWLSPTNVTNQHHDLQNRRSRFPKTTKWIFNEPVWKEWLLSYQASNHLFWLSGIPGAGKTVLFSSIVDELPNHTLNTEECAVIFFYCKNNDSTKNTYEEIARSLISQLLNNNQNCLSYLYDQAMRSCERYAKTKKDYETLILSMIQCYTSVYIGIDGLDEIELLERKDMLLLVHNIMESSQEASNVRFFLSSRAERDIEQSLRLSKRLDLKPHHLQSDISNYVGVEARKLNEKLHLDSGKVAEMTAVVADRSAGMFLLARLIMENLQDQDSRSDVEEELRSDILPQGIDQAYGRILMRIQKLNSPRNQTRAKQVLELLARAKRKLQLHEIQGALSIRTEDRSIEFQKRKYLNHFKDLCGPIIEVDDDATVDFVHITAKKFLEESHSSYMSSDIAEYNLSNLCVRYLTFDCFKDGLNDQEIMCAIQQGKYAFQDYSFCYWLPHVKSLQVRSTDFDRDHAVIRPCLELLTLHFPEICQPIEQGVYQPQKARSEISISGLLSHAEELYKKSNVVPDTLQSDELVPKHLTSLLRIRRFIEQAVEDQQGKPYQQTLRDAYGPAPFKCSILSCPRFGEGFHTREKRDLHVKKHARPFKCTQHGCDYYVFGFSSQDQLATHTTLAHTPTHLPQRFTKFKPRSIWDALRDAIDENSLFAVRALCSEILALPTKQTGFIHYAVKKGSIDAAKALIELLGYREELNFRDDKSHESTIEAALKEGQVELSHLLLTKMGKIHLWPTDICTLLRCAVAADTPEVLHILFQHFPPSSFDRPYNRVQIRKAFKTARVEATQLLFLEEIGQSCLPQTGPAFEIILKAVVANGFVHVVSRMLEIAQAGELRRKLSAELKDQLAGGIDSAVADLMSSQRGHSISNVQKAAADLISSQRGHSTSNVQEAAYSGDLLVVEKFLQKGISINDIQGEYGTALQAAANAGHDSMVRFLLEKGASVNARGGIYGSALNAAAAKGHSAIAAMLLDAGAEMTSICQSDAGPYPLELGDYTASSFTPLHLAVFGRHLKVIRILLDRGADIRAVTQVGDNALHLATYPRNRSHSKYFGDTRTTCSRVFEILLNRGLDINSRNYVGNTPLHELVGHIPFSRSPLDVIRAARLMLQDGADLDIKNNAGHTPREMARRIIPLDENTILDLLLQS